MCFSIRPTEVKRFRTVLRCDVDLSLRVLASLRNRPHRPFHDGIRRTKWNYLQGVLCAHEAQGTAHAPNSLRPSSREGQLSASTRNRKLLLLVRSSIPELSALSRLHFPCPAESVPLTQMRCRMTASRRAKATIAFCIPRRAATFIAHAF